MPVEYFRNIVRTLIGTGLENIPASYLRKLAGPPVVIDGVELDLTAQVILRFLEPLPKIEQLSVEQNRVMDNLDQYAQTVPETFYRIEDRTIPGPGGDLSIRLYTPSPSEEARPLLIYFHGGNSVAGDLDTHNPTCCHLARDGDCQVMAVHYRRLPEHKFPAAQEDACSAFEWARANGAELGVDPRRIAVGGEGSGGGLAASVAARYRDRGPGESGPCYQLLLYPHLDLTRDNYSYRIYGQGFMLTAALLEYFDEQYLNDEVEKRDPRVSPGLNPDLKGVAPACIITAGFDPVRDEAHAYAEALERAGVSVRYTCYETMIHYFINLTLIFPEGRAALEQAGAELRRNFARVNTGTVA